MILGSDGYIVKGPFTAGSSLELNPAIASMQAAHPQRYPRYFIPTPRKQTGHYLTVDRACIEITLDPARSDQRRLLV